METYSVLPYFHSTTKFSKYVWILDYVNSSLHENIFLTLPGSCAGCKGAWGFPLLNSLCNAQKSWEAMRFSQAVPGWPQSHFHTQLAPGTWGSLCWTKPHSACHVRPQDSGYRDSYLPTLTSHTYFPSLPPGPQGCSELAETQSHTVGVTIRPFHMILLCCWVFNHHFPKVWDFFSMRMKSALILNHFLLMQEIGLDKNQV